MKQLAAKAIAAWRFAIRFHKAAGGLAEILGTLGIASLLQQDGGMVEVLGGQLVLALLLAADAPGCPAHRGFGLALDRLAEEGFRLGKASFGGRLDPGVVELGVVELVGLNPDRPIPMAATQRSFIELGRAQIAAAQIRALQLGAA